MKSIFVFGLFGYLFFCSIVQAEPTPNCNASGGKIVSYLSSQIDEYGKLTYDCPPDLPTDPEQYCEVYCKTLTSRGELSSYNGYFHTGDSTDFPADALACTACVVKGY